MLAQRAAICRSGKSDTTLVRAIRAFYSLVLISDNILIIHGQILILQDLTELLSGHPLETLIAPVRLIYCCHQSVSR